MNGSFLLSRFTRLLFVVVAVGVSGCGTANVNFITGEQQRGAYTWQQEVQLGTEANQQIVAQFGLVEEGPLTEYVRGVAESVLATSAYTDPNTPAEVRATPFHFQVLDSPVVNAFALPGGYVYVTRGLLAFLENEAQLAVVLGHEIGHVLGRHSSEQAARAQLGQLGLLGAAVLGGVVGGGRVAEGILNYGGAGAQLLFMRYGRDAERESDRAGVAYAGFAGYDAAQGSRFFRALRMLGEQSGQSVPGFLSTHPDPGEREQTILQLAAQGQNGTRVEARSFLNQIEGIVLGNDPRQGFAEGGRFYHPELRFVLSYPQGWNMQNTPSAVQFSNPNGGAGAQLTLAQQSTAADAARAFAGQQGVQVSESRALSIQGNRAARVEGSVASQNGTLGFTATFIEYGGNVYQIVGFGTSAVYAGVAASLRSMADSFAPLADSRYLSRQPVRLEVRSLTRPSTLQSLLSGRPMPDGLSAAEFGIMNQVTLTEPLPAGALVKLPR